ncbi:uncharacterized protein VTP21DRAFT_10291 [Calcarisporiella thermophila]|uniref:uncharacterized protein n=1 Tax=Calcarisporiella thermophila TaxID=911321 RepID=UPI003741EED5
MDAVSRRLLKELRDFQADPQNPDLLELSPINDDDLLVWKAVLRGQRDSLYEGGIFELRIEVPRTYPIHPPSVRFITKICHPNIHFKTGEICLDILKTAWSPAWTLATTCTAIQLLLAHPEPSSPLNCDAANLMRCGDMVAYGSLVRMYTQLYAAEDRESDTEEDREKKEDR